MSENDKSKSGKSKKSGQGSQLPVDGSPLSAYPIGSCVRIKIEESFDWYMIVMRIGGSGNPHVRKMVHPPTSSDWNVGPSYAREVSNSLAVQQSAWPRRATDERGLDADSDMDPFLGNLRLDGSMLGESGSSSSSASGRGRS